MKQPKNRKRKNEAGFSLISVVFVMLAMSSIGVSLTSTVSNRAVTSAEDVNAAQAFYAADGVLQYILADEFMNETDYTNASGSGTHSFGSATTSVAYSNVTANAATITVTSTVGGSSRTVQQTVSHAIPLQSPVFSEGDFAFTGPEPCINLIFFTLCWDAGEVDGNLGAGGSITHPDYFTVSGTSTENMDVNLPDVETENMVAYTDTEHTGDLTIGPGANLFSPVVYNQNVHVTGDVYIENFTVINGRIVADGDIHINGNTVVNGSLISGGNINGSLADNTAFFDTDGPNGETMPVLMAEGSIYLTVEGLGSITDGLVYAGGDITYHGDIGAWYDLLELILIDGALITHGNINLENDRGYVYVGADSNLITNLAQNGSVRLSNWREL